MRKNEMRPSAIVYTSNTGHTRRYSLLLGDQLGLPVYSLDEAKSQLSDGCPSSTSAGFMQAV